MAEQPVRTEIQIRIPDDILKGQYANLVRVDATREEFILDFASVSPQQGNGIVTARIFMSPQHMRRFVDVLQRVLTQHHQHEKSGDPITVTETSKEIGFDTK